MKKQKHEWTEQEKKESPLFLARVVKEDTLRFRVTLNMRNRTGSYSKCDILTSPKGEYFMDLKTAMQVAHSYNKGKEFLIPEKWFNFPSPADFYNLMDN